MNMIIVTDVLHREDDVAWPKKNIVGRQELEVRIDKEHISFEVSWTLRRPRRPGRPKVEALETSADTLD